MILKLSLAALAILLSRADSPNTYECQRLTLQGNNVIEIVPIPCPTMKDDDPAWNCATMGNLICGDVRNPVYWSIRK